MLNLPKLQAFIAPLSAPIPSAISVGAEAYHFITPQTNEYWGYLAAFAAFIGIETVGGASCYATIKLHRQRDYGAEFWVSICGILVYIASGLWTLANSPTIIFFFLAPFAYFAYSILQSMEQEIDAKTNETEAQIRLIEAETRRTNAESRKIKVEKTESMQNNAKPMQTDTKVQSYICSVCNEKFDNPRKFAAHSRWKHPKS